MQSSYWRFAAMVGTSGIVMLVLMYLNTYGWEHVYWSEMRAWMAALMAASMAIIMLAFMMGMYKNTSVNVSIFLGGALVFALSLWAVRSQATITGTDYMKAMIPHHSIAILTSSRSGIEDQRVRKLADEIIEAQRKEIAEMRYLVRVMEGADTLRTLPGEGGTSPRLVSASEAIHQADPAKTDLEEMDDADVDKAIGQGPRCTFRYGRSSPAVLAVRLDPAAPESRAVAKVNGHLFELSGSFVSPERPWSGRVELVAPGMSIALAPVDEADAVGQASVTVESDAVMRIDKGVEAGYGGFFTCDQTSAS